MDLSKLLQPFKLELPGLGHVSIDLRTTSFLNWIERGEKKDLWRDPKRLVLDILGERTTTDTGSPPPAEAILALSSEHVEEIANTIALNVSSLFRRGESAKTGEDDFDDSPDLKDDPQETGAARLKRVSLAYLAYHRAQTRRLLETVRKASAATEFLRQSDTLSATLRIQNELSRGVLGSGLYSRSLFGFERDSSLVKSLEGLTSSSLMAQHRSLATEMMKPNSAFSNLQKTLDGLIGIRTARSIASNERFFDNAKHWTDAVNLQLRLGLPASVIGAISENQTATATASAAIGAQIAMILRPSFQTAASLALEGLAARGAIADLLRHYGAIRPIAPVFDSVRATLASLDDEEPSAEEFMGLLEKAWSKIAGLIAESPDLIRNPAFAMWLGVLLALASASLAAYQVFGPPSPEIISRLDEGNDQLRDINEQLAAQRETQESRRFIRYVHTVVNLRAEPHRAGQLIRLVYPDQVVRVIDTRGEWASVEDRKSVV